MPEVIIYDWSPWEGFLLPGLFPEALRVRAQPGESGRDVYGRLPRPADSPTLFFFHVNLTDTSHCPSSRRWLCRALATSGYLPVNGHVDDISKRRIQRLCVEAGLHSTRAPRAGSSDELVIVKTDRNYGGEPEGRLTADQCAAVGIEHGPVEPVSGHGYRVCARCEVTAWEWSSPALVVERYVDNADHRFYRAFVLGTREVLLEGAAEGPVRTISRSHRRRRWFFQVGDDHPSMPAGVSGAMVAVQALRRAMRLDFGCIDLVKDDAGRFYAIDVNTTPWWTRGETGLESHLLGGVGDLERILKARVGQHAA